MNWIITAKFAIFSAMASLVAIAFREVTIFTAASVAATVVAAIVFVFVSSATCVPAATPASRGTAMPSESAMTLEFTMIPEPAMPSESSTSAVHTWVAYDADDNDFNYFDDVYTARAIAAHKKIYNKCTFYNNHISFNRT